MNARTDAAFAAVDADIARNPPTFPQLDDFPEAPPPQAQGTQVLLTCGTDLNPEPIRWLWKDWLALGKLHILAGAPGQGKTTLALTMGATITIGGAWPDGSQCEAGNILIWSGEDDPGDTLLPRLLAAGAERSRCYFIEGARTEDGEVQPFDPSRDLPGLLQAIQHIGGIRLLVIDPVVSAVTGDSHKNTEVRRALQPLVNLATACDCAVLGITHFAKGGQGTDPAQRVVGSVAFTAVARVVLVAAKVKSLEDGQDARILARSKSNIGPDEGGFNYHLEQCEPLSGIQASRIAWGEAVQGNARDLLTDPEGDEEDNAQDICDMLREALTADCWTPVDTAQRGLLRAGFSKKQVWSASKKLNVIRKKGEDGPRDGWYWRLPPGAQDSQDSTQDSQGSNVQNAESWNLGTLAESENGQNQASNVVPIKPGPKEAF
ncbi:AAA family ATPase [Comamonas sp. GB3 AK4-5]|uniref:AAA family ATPase n=1 Tax=Comamonas sp. GB3 AK4-5 TaxID=3231487 RepID=UPI00351E5D06